MNATKFFGHVPYSSNESQAFPVIRCSPVRPIIGTVWSDKPLGAYVHWWQGRTTPCDRQTSCPACAESCEVRYESYVFCELSESSKVVIVAIPYLASRWIIDYVKRNGSLFGRAMVVERVGKTKRSQVTVKLCGPTQPGSSAPPLPSLESTMLRLWGLRSQSEKD